MKLKLIAIMMLINFLNCGLMIQDKNKMTAINFYYSWPTPKDNGEIFEMNDTSLLVYYKDLTLNKRYVTNYIETEDTFEITKTYYYLLQKQGEKAFYKFDSLTQKYGKMCDYDSVMKYNFFSTFKFFTQENKDLFERKQFTSSGIIMEKYVPVIKKDSTYPDTAVFYFAKDFPSVKFTFDSLVEKKRKRKLTNIDFIFNKRYDSITHVMKPSKHLGFGILKYDLSAEEKQSYLNLFTRFELLKK